MRKITAGFKCNPQLKSELITEANESGLTLSEYLESLCENRNNSNEHINLINQPDYLEELEHLRSRLYEYEEVLLGSLFAKNQNTEVKVKLPNGRVFSRFIKQPQDILEVILASLKPQS